MAQPSRSSFAMMNPNAEVEFQIGRHAEATGIYVQEVAIYIREIGTRSQEIGSYSGEIATDSREMGIYSGEIAGRSPESPFTVRKWPLTLKK